MNTFNSLGTKKHLRIHNVIIFQLSLHTSVLEFCAYRLGSVDGIMPPRRTWCTLAYTCGGAPALACKIEVSSAGQHTHTRAT